MQFAFEIQGNYSNYFSLIYHKEYSNYFQIIYVITTHAITLKINDAKLEYNLKLFEQIIKIN